MLSDPPSKSLRSSKALVVWIALVGIILLGGFMRFYHLGASDIGNTYYAATVQSMLTSWHNFFYAAFEPGGSVSVDKPPVGFWLQALSAYFLGVNGFSLALPQALVGVLSIPLLFSLVKRAFGNWPAVAAALALAVMPVTIATERNNTMDGTLVFVLLLAAWAVIKSIETSRFRYFFLGAVLVAVGFNIKMLQAYMVLPAFFGIYLLFAPQALWKKFVHLAVAGVTLFILSFAWIALFDLTPPAERPFAGSSTDNSMLELVIGHNGLERFGLGQSGPGRPVQAQGMDGGLNPGAPPPRPAGQFLPPGARDNDGGPGFQAPGGSRLDEVGQPGLLRLFTRPLAEEASWLLPAILLGLPVLALLLRWANLNRDQQIAFVFWAAWLLPMLAYFSITSGLWHTYYLIMLGPAIAALAAGVAWGFWNALADHHRGGLVLILVISAVTALYACITLWEYPQYALLPTTLICLTWLAGIILLACPPLLGWRKYAAAVLLCTSLVTGPFTLAMLTTFNPNPNTALPNAGPDSNPGIGQPSIAPGQMNSNALIAYLLANTQPESYLVATLDSHSAAPFILATKRPVLTFGGFNGGDNVITLDHLKQWVAGGKIKFILGGNDLTARKPEIGRWVTQNCVPVKIGQIPMSQSPQIGGPLQPAVLYNCEGAAAP